MLNITSRLVLRAEGDALFGYSGILYNRSDFLNFILLCIFEAGSSSLLPPPGMESYFLSHRSSEATPASEHPYYSTIQSTKKQYVCLNSQYS